MPTMTTISGTFNIGDYVTWYQHGIDDFVSVARIQRIYWKGNKEYATLVWLRKPVLHSWRMVSDVEELPTNWVRALPRAEAVLMLLTALS